MFENLSERLDKIFRNLRGKGYLTEDNIKAGLREVRMALLEADVNFRIVKNFIAEVEKRALGVEVMKSLTPGQQVVKIVYEQLVNLMDTEGFQFKVYNNRLTKVMLVGLQGSGKTTACAKLAAFYRKKGIKPMLVACDVYRPAAVDQLKILGKQIGIPVVSEDTKNVLKIADSALSMADKEMVNLLIFDTAGRLHIDEPMMEEVARLKTHIKPDYIFFVADATTGQDAVTIAKDFYDKLAFDAVILTKLDGDARVAEVVAREDVVPLQHRDADERRGVGRHVPGAIHRDRVPRHLHDAPHLGPALARENEDRGAGPVPGPRLECLGQRQGRTLGPGDGAVV